MKREDMQEYPKINLTFVNFGKKHDRGKGFNFREAGAFRGICMLGAEQILDCYQWYDHEMSEADVMLMCSSCKYSCNECFSLKRLARQSKMMRPFFINEIVPVVDPIDETPGYYVYFISDGEFVKIGISKDVQKRLADIQVGNPKPVSVLFSIPVRSKSDALELECRLHNIYSDFAKCGEWFDILNYIDVKAFQEYFS